MTASGIRVALVGAGFIGGVHAAALLSLAWEGAVDLSLIAVADTDPARRDEAVRRFGWARSSTDALEVASSDDVDVVIVATPNSEHRAVVERALAADKAVVCEKPLAATLDDAASILSGSERHAGGIAAMSFVFRSWPAVQFARTLLASGEIGEPFSFRGHMYHGYALDGGRPLGWRARPQVSGGGALVDVGSHIIDIARCLMGEIDAVSARLHSVVARPEDSAAASKADDAADLQVQFSTGASGAIHASWAAAGYGSDVAFEILGSRGALAFSWTRRDELTLAATGEGRRTIQLTAAETGDPNLWTVPGLGSGYRDAFVSFYRAIFGSPAARASAATLFDGYRCLQVIDAAQRSSQSAAERIRLGSVLSTGARNLASTSS